MKAFILILIIFAVLGGMGYLYYHWKIVDNQREVMQYPDVPYSNNLGKTLVIYYSLKGHTRSIAETVADLTGADMYRIETIEAVDASRWFPLNVLKQLAFHQYPSIKAGTPNLSDYDTIFVGGPVWWCMPATPLLSFLNKTDFNAKPVVPFSAQGGMSGWFFDRFKKDAENASLRQGAAFNQLGPKYAKETKFKIINWLNDLPPVKSE